MTITQSKIHPVAGYLLLQPQKQEQTTASGILLPDNHAEKPQQGKVLAVGGAIFDDGREISAPCQIDDIVVYREWGGKEIKDNNVDLLLLKFDDIMAIVEETKKSAAESARDLYNKAVKEGQVNHI